VCLVTSSQAHVRLPYSQGRSKEKFQRYYSLPAALKDLKRGFKTIVIKSQRPRQVNLQLKPGLFLKSRLSYKLPCQTQQIQVMSISRFFLIFFYRKHQFNLYIFTFLVVLVIVIGLIRLATTVKIVDNPIQWRVPIQLCSVKKRKKT
jgi:hypothetical protein